MDLTSHLRFTPGSISGEARWFLFARDRVLMVEGDAGPTLPTAGDPAPFGLQPEGVMMFATLDGQPCLAASCQADLPAPEGCAFVNPRALFGAIPDRDMAAVLCAAHLTNWERAHRVCGVCGKPLDFSSDDRSKRCSVCSQVYYPQIAPAVIVAVRRGRELLLAHGARFPDGMYSCLAGFVEAGESLEDCMHREIREEVGIEICNMRYFGSQPWPFPSSLMLGFVADYASGELQVDGVEITAADWFTPESLPSIPGSFSIARAMIEDWRRN